MTQDSPKGKAIIPPLAQVAAMGSLQVPERLVIRQVGADRVGADRDGADRDGEKAIATPNINRGGLNKSGVLWDTLKQFETLSSIDDVDNAFRSIIEESGFSRFAYLVLRFNRVSNVGPLIVSDYPDEWCRRYIEESYHVIDPIIVDAARGNWPFEWGTRTYLDQLTDSQKRMLHDASEHGIMGGLSIPIHGPSGCFAVTTFARGENNKRREFSIEQTSFLHTATLYYHDRQSQAVEPTKGVDLSPREVEVLTWSAKGKTAWEIAQILTLSQHTVISHLESAKKKLDSHSKNHAVVRAVLLGLIHP